MRIVYYNYIQAEAVTKLRTFADACAYPSAKRITVHGSTGPVNAVEADGTLFIQNDEAEAEAIRSKAMEPASEVVAPSKVAARTAAASEVAEPAVATAAPEDPAATASPAVIESNSFAAAVSKPSVRPKPSAVKSSSYAAAVSKPSVRPKPSAAASRLSADLKRSTAASKPAAAVPTPLEVNTSYPNVHAQCTRSHFNAHGVCGMPGSLPEDHRETQFESHRSVHSISTALAALPTELFPFHCNLCSVWHCVP